MCVVTSQANHADDVLDWLHLPAKPSNKTHEIVRAVYLTLVIADSEYLWVDGQRHNAMAVCGPVTTIRWDHELPAC